VAAMPAMLEVRKERRPRGLSSLLMGSPIEGRYGMDVISLER
jgi:hypothetical protein